MKSSSLSRILAVLILSIPVAMLMAGRARRGLAAIDADPAGYAQHQRLYLHPMFFAQFIRAIVLLGLIVGLTELIALLLRRSILKAPSDDGAA